MKFNMIILISVCLLALGVASKLRSPVKKSDEPTQNNSDTPNFTGVQANGKPEPAILVKPTVIIPAVIVETPIIGSGFQNFTNSCTKNSYSFNKNTNTLTAKCLTYERKERSSSLDLNNCFVSSSYNKLEYSSFYNSSMKAYCSKCTVNLNSLFLECTCKYSGQEKLTTINLNVNVGNKNGYLYC